MRVDDEQLKVPEIKSKVYRSHQSSTKTGRQSDCRLARRNWEQKTNVILFARDICRVSKTTPWIIGPTHWSFQFGFLTKTAGVVNANSARDLVLNVLE